MSLRVSLPGFVRLCAVLVWATLAACGPSETCSPSDMVTPCLADLQFLGQGEANPLVLRFRTFFADDDGDLGGGFLETLLDGNATSLGGLSMREIFAENALNTNDTSGLIDVNLELTLQNDDLPPSGTRFTVGMRAVDEAEHRSELAEVELELTF